MANVEILDENSVCIHVALEDAVQMVKWAAEDIKGYASEIVTISEKMPAFDFIYFCFYAYDSARLFERLLGVDPRQYTSFSLDAPDAFFYALYGGMQALYAQAVQYATSPQEN
ncbi:hypothetical protein LSG31_07455 [Fodinisporobacter ferrooxydans]|uniref:Uncharacterized protein n=1 Tax=Fodinisporobacter ferrooxydans TaxID=2901836 RepID=A0ABY4CS59_9BACL|nr:hypothetical protein LSG31_07455 [Alicyclobacillaceae bacterium MYW30-H2]